MQIQPTSQDFQEVRWYTVPNPQETTTPGTHYAMGFAVSPDGQQVLLLEKNRPAFLAGQWVGLAGHIEPGETPAQAVRREGQEEGNIGIDEWALLGVVDGQANPQDKIFMFAVRHGSVPGPRADR